MDKLYLARKALGVCIGCGVKNASAGTVRCDECRKEDNENTAQRQKRLKAAGLCGGCLRNKPAPGMKMCASCRILSAAAARKRAAAKESSAAMCISREVDGLG